MVHTRREPAAFLRYPGDPRRPHRRERFSGLSPPDPSATACHPGPACPNRTAGKSSVTSNRSRIPGIRTKHPRRRLLHPPRRNQSQRTLPLRRRHLRISALSSPVKFARSQRRIFQHPTSLSQRAMVPGWSTVLTTRGQRHPPDSPFSNTQRDSTLRGCSGLPPTAMSSSRKAAVGKSEYSVELRAMANRGK